MKRWRFTASLTTLRGQDERRGWLGADGQRLGEVFFRDVEPALSLVRATISDLSIGRRSGTKLLLHRVRRGLSADHPQSPAADAAQLDALSSAPRQDLLEAELD